MSAPLLLNLGCGHVTPAGWVNVDGSNRACLASQWPVIDSVCVTLGLFPKSEFANGITLANFFIKLPWADGSADAVYLGEVMDV